MAFVNAADLGNNGGTSDSHSVNYTAGSDSGRMLVVGIAGDTGGSDVILGVTYGGDAFTSGVKMAGGNRHMYLYFLFGVAHTGTNAVVIEASTTTYILAVIAEYSGMLTSDEPDATTADAAGGSVTLTVDTVADDCWAIAVGGHYDANLPLTAGSGATRRAYDATYGSVAIFDSGGPITPAGAYGITLVGGNTVTGVAASFAPAAEEGGGGNVLSVRVGEPTYGGGLIT